MVGWTLYYVLELYLLLGSIHLGLLFTILTPPHKYSRRLGEDLTLRCEFRTPVFNHFDNPVMWLKTQHHEVTPLNIQGTINEPFAATRRFKVDFDQDHPVYKFELTIHGLTRADNGNYTCVIKGSQSRILANVTHDLQVQAPVDAVYVTNDNSSEVGSAPSRLMYTEHIPGTFRCISHGGYPAPDVQVSVGGQDVDDHLGWTYLPQFRGETGLRTMSYIVERWSHDFTAKAEYDGKEALCTAAVPGLTTQATAVRMKVNYYPKIQCEDKFAYVGQRNVTLLCSVSSRPRTTSVKWLINKNGTHYDVMASTAYWTTMRIINDTTVHALLHISKTGERRFTTYTVEATNAIGTSLGTVTLRKVFFPEPSMTTPWPVWRPYSTPRPSLDTAPGGGGSHYVFIISKASSTSFQSISILSLLTISLLTLLFNLSTQVEQITSQPDEQKHTKLLLMPLAANTNVISSMATYLLDLPYSLFRLLLCLHLPFTYTRLKSYLTTSQHKDYSQVQSKSIRGIR